jgi:uncharacterized protein (TIGR03000 family)
VILPTTPTISDGQLPGIPVSSRPAAPSTVVANSSPAANPVAQVAPANPITPAMAVQPVSRAPGEQVKKAASLVVTLPADARLFVDNVECPIKSLAVRSFNTRPLDVNQLYFYTIRIDMVRDGRTVSDSRHVTVVPGQEIRVNFNQSATTGQIADIR